MSLSDEPERNRSFRAALILALFIMLIDLATVALVREEGMRVIISDALTTLTSWLAFIGLVYAARHSQGRARNAWMVLAAALLANAFAELAWAAIEIGLHQNPFPSVADVGYLMYYPLFAIGVYLLPAYPLSHSEKLKILLDASIVMVAAALVFWVFLIAPIVAASQAITLELGISVAYPVMDLVIFFALMELLFRKLDSSGSPAIPILALSIVIKPRARRNKRRDTLTSDRQRR